MSPHTNAYRIFTDPKGVKQMHFIDATGSVVQLEPGAAQRGLPDGYYTRGFKLIALAPKPRALLARGKA